MLGQSVSTTGNAPSLYWWSSLQARCKDTELLRPPHLNSPHCLSLTCVSTRRDSDLRLLERDQNRLYILFWGLMLLHWAGVPKLELTLPTAILPQSSPPLLLHGRPDTSANTPATTTLCYSKLSLLVAVKKCAFVHEKFPFNHRRSQE